MIIGTSDSVRMIVDEECAMETKRKMTLEVCVESVESALAAVEGGADRLELCADLIIGGTTPSPALFRAIRRRTDIPMHVMIRPRFGDFCYTESELEIMKDQIEEFRDLGAEGIVLGILKSDGSLDTEKMTELLACAEGMRVTLHRCFDMCRDPEKTLEEAVKLGVSIILTSGQKDRCVDGTELLRELQQKAAGRIIIQAGSGVEAGIIREVYEKTGICAYHMSGSRVYDSLMTYRKEGVSMGLPGFSEYEIRSTDCVKIREARRVLDQCME